ncbi:MAG: GNAT family N-acetyltransferase [Stenotrophomonas koreensis]
MPIRQATPADAALLCELSTRTFVETFGHLYRPEDLAAYLAVAYPQDLQRAQLESGDYAAWILELDGEPAGFVFVGPCGLPHPQADPADGEIKRLYVLAAHHNAGWGRALMDQAMAWLTARTARQWLGVWSENLGAQRFYARYGFERVGQYEFPVGQARDLEYILRRPAQGTP